MSDLTRYLGKTATDRQDWIGEAILVLVVALLFLDAPINGVFWWSDAPRHALNGVFVKDLVATMPLSDPVGYAERYYLQYPSLTILFYPPLFYAISAPFFAIFGVSQETALFVVMLHYVAFALGLYRLFRFWLDPGFALAAAFTVIAGPEIAFRGRQVMLEIPAFAFMVWSLVFFVGYLRDKSAIWRLYVAAAILVFGLYTKLGILFLGPVFLAVLFYERGRSLLRDEHSYIIAALAIVGLIPLAILTLKFGQANVQSVVGVADAEASRGTIWGWFWYLAEVPDQIGYAALAAVVAGLLSCIAFRTKLNLSATDLLLWAIWLVVGYLFFSSVDLKEARHSVFILPPLIFAAVLALSRLTPRSIGLALALIVAVTTFGETVFARPVLYVGGFADAAADIAKRAPKDAIVMFSGYRDGAFTFNMRTREDRRDITTLRADKLFLEIAVRRGLGVTEKALTEDEIRALLNRLRVSYVVAQPGFWTDLAVMQRLESVLHGSTFQAVARIKTRANYEAAEDELVIYRNLGPLAKGPVMLDLELKIIERHVFGEAGTK